MRAILRAVIDNTVLVNLAFVVVVVAGVQAWLNMPKEQFPQISTDRVVVSVVYPGASPQDVEDQVIRPIEDALKQVEGIKHVYTTAIEGRSDTTLELTRGTDPDQARNDVERAVTGLSDLPEDAGDPVVVIARVEVPITYVGLTGDITRVDLADRLADELAAFQGVSEVDVRGAAERVVRVDLDPAKVAARGLTPADVAAAIERAGRGGPAGDVRRSGERVLVRTERALVAAPDVAAVPLTVRDGTTLRVGDLAHVYEDWDDPVALRHVNGQPAIVLALLRNDDADAVQIVSEVEAWVAERAPTLPPGLGLLSYDDSARIVVDRIDTVMSNAAVGLVLVGVLLFVFIGWRNGLLVLWGMPVAFCGAIALLQLQGTTINVISTFALLLVTGIIVDDAIIIVENVARHLEMGKTPMTAAVDGTMEVIAPVFASTLTTCLAFAPLLMLEGTVGQVMSIIPIVVIFALAGSLLEAFFILPSHLAHYGRPARVQGDNLPTRFLKRLYAPVVTFVTRPGVRYVTVLALTAGFVAVLGLAAVMKKELTTPGNPYFANVDVALPPTSSTERTRAALGRIEAWLADNAGDMTVWIASTTGTQPNPSGLPQVGAEFGQVRVGFVNDAAVFARVPALLDELRAEMAADPELVRYGIETLRGGPPAGRDIEVRVRSREPAQVFPVARALDEHLRGRAGVYDVRNESEQGADAFQVRVDPGRATRFGLSEAQVARAARGALDGALAIEIPIAERTTEIRVGLAGMRRADLEDLRDLPLVTPDGRTVRLRQVATVSRVPTVRNIDRVDGQRAVILSALVDDDVTSAEDEVEALDAAFAAQKAEHPDVTLFYGGAVESSNEGFRSLVPAAVLAMLLMYAVLAVQFRSYVQPILILAAVPLGISGVILGLFAFGMNISLIALIGAIGLAGIVVNDSLVLIDFINKERVEGMGARQAVIDGALTRLRPILITTATTVAGLLPLALGIAGGEPLLAPMAVAISVGLAFATALTLVAIPVLYMVVEDVRGLPGRLTGRGARAAARAADEFPRVA